MTRGPEFRGNLARRVGTAAVAIPALLAILFLAPPAATLALVAAASAVGLLEYFGLLSLRSVRPFRVVGALVFVLLFVEALRGAGLGGLLPAAVPVLPFVMVLLLSALLHRAAEIPAALPALAATLFGAAYLGALGGTMAALRTLHPDEEGAWRVAFLLAVIMSADTFAFAAGTAFGRHKLAPRVSPGKTVEGLGGGLAGGVVAALLVRRLGLPDLPVAHAVLLGASVAGLGVVGDLAESFLKRWAGAKDSGALFPGHGGMLDRLDSLLFGAPVLYYYFLVRP